MAESKTVAVVPLNSSNCSIWKVQCKMVLMKDGLWSFVSGTEIAPVKGAEQQAEFCCKGQGFSDYCAIDRSKFVVPDRNSGILWPINFKGKLGQTN